MAHLGRHFYLNPDLEPKLEDIKKILEKPLKRAHLRNNVRKSVKTSDSDLYNSLPTLTTLWTELAESYGLSVENGKFFTLAYIKTRNLESELNFESRVKS